MKNKIIKLIKADTILFVSAILMLISTFFTKIDKTIFLAIDWRVLSILLSLMIVVENLKEAKLFDYLCIQILKKIKNTRSLAIALIVLCFVSSMFITNDVALITFVPLTLILLKNINDENLLIDTIILETVSANLGSQFTPIGNPQNLYLYSHFNLDIKIFLNHMLFLTIVSLILVLISGYLLPKSSIENKLKINCEIDNKNCFLWTLSFVLCVLSVLNIISYYPLPFIFIILSFFTNKKALKNVDYSILLTFIFLFIFIRNLLNISAFNTYILPFLKENIFLSGILLSQVISNVPAAILLGPLTSDWQKLIYAVNIAGLGTLIASMASIISYKIYAASINSKKGKFLKRFTIYNFIMLIVIALIAYIYLKW